MFLRNFAATSVRLPGLALALALPWAGCLTVDGIDRRDDEPDAGEPAGGDGDGDSDGDGDAAPPATACKDRGSYQISDIIVRGMKQACDGDLVCVESSCVPLPDCTPGYTGECLFTLPVERGALLHQPFAQGDYVYWFEEGNYDALDNYQFDGAMARAKVGTWQREELRSGMDLRRFASLWREGSWVRGWQWSETSPTLRAFSLDGKAQYDVWDWSCISDDGVEYWSEGKSLFTKDLATGIVSEAKGKFPSSNPLCRFVSKDHVWFGFEAKFYRVERGAQQQLRAYQPYADLLDVRQDVLVASRDRRKFVATAQLDGASEELTWINRAGGTDDSLGEFYLNGNEVRWGRHDDGRKYAVVMRSSLAGLGATEVVAEMPEVAQLGEIDRPNATMLHTTTGALWSGPTAGTLHYAPLPEFSPSR
jgi:hypothetical protein